MDVILKPRQSGKTTELVNNTIKYNGYLLVHSNEEKDRLERRYPELKNKIFLMNAVTIKEKLRGRPLVPIFIDNVEFLLQQLLRPFEIKQISINTEEKQKRKSKTKYQLINEKFNVEVAE